MPPWIKLIRDVYGPGLIPVSTATAAVFDEDGRVLLVHRTENGKWALPGGFLDPGEQWADAAAREVLEETGVLVVPESVVAVTITDEVTYKNGDQIQGNDVLFRCRVVGGEARVNDEESTDVRWFEDGAEPPLDRRQRALLRLARANRPEAAFSFSGDSGLGGQRQWDQAVAAPGRGDPGVWTVRRWSARLTAGQRRGREAGGDRGIGRIRRLAERRRGVGTGARGAGR